MRWDNNAIVSHMLHAGLQKRFRSENRIFYFLFNILRIVFCSSVIL